MGRLAADPLVYMALGLLGVSISMHLLAGLAELRRVLTDEGLFWFMLSMFIAALLPIIIVWAMWNNHLPVGPTYLVFAGLMSLYLVAYADVHGFGHLESLTGIDLHTHDHVGHDHHDHNHHDHGHEEHGDGSAMDTVVDHLRGDIIALLSKLAEGTAVIVFVGLAIRDW